MSAKATDAECRLILLIADIREAVGDPEGRLIQSELVEHCRGMRKDAERMRWLLSGHGYFMEERGLCGHGPCDQDEQGRARKQIDEELDRLMEAIRAANEKAATLPLAGSGQKRKLDSSGG